MPRLLVVEDEPVLARNLTKAFASRGFEITHASSVREALGVASSSPTDVALVDLRLPDGNGLDVLAALLVADPELPVVIMTAYGSVADAVEAMRRGARDYVQKPLELEEIRLKVERALGAARERREISYHRERQTALGDILGASPAVDRLRHLVTRIARATAGPGQAAPTVLLLGPTGSGKGHVARTLHASGGRHNEPFIEVNCAALPEHLVEVELFGHERGAFTDAKGARAGLFETADGGAIFLDEIGHLPPELQSKFLKVIDEKTVRRVGATGARRVDVQIIAATSRDLEEAVRVGAFREDLFQRLSVAVIDVPPLRERGGDVILLAETFLETTTRRYGMPGRTLSAEAKTAMQAYTWPGNVRELANAMERVVLFSDVDPIGVEDLGLPVPGGRATKVFTGPTGTIEIDFPDTGVSLDAVERVLLTAALERAGGNQSRAARLLGISRDTMRYRLEKFGLG